jgi:hypothetical protein
VHFHDFGHLFAQILLQLDVPLGKFLIKHQSDFLKRIPKNSN